ncbi:MAG TPA: hypothetical protein VFR84_04405 [Candidatus Angelobacter sp.]|nr:hypothetical protein [Candidatus Angelobacter sp.]
MELVSIHPRRTKNRNNFFDTMLAQPPQADSKNWVVFWPVPVFQRDAQSGAENPDRLTYCMDRHWLSKPPTFHGILGCTSLGLWIWLETLRYPAALAFFSVDPTDRWSVFSQPVQT